VGRTGDKAAGTGRRSAAKAPETISRCGGPAADVTPSAATLMTVPSSSEGTRRERRDGQIVKRASFTRSVKETEPAIPGRGKGRPCV